MQRHYKVEKLDAIFFKYLNGYMLDNIYFVNYSIKLALK
jgi:hypothetical protein